MNELFMFDIDGTLIRSYMREGAPRSEYDRVDLLPNRKETIDRLCLRAGVHFALITNQGGVAFGYQTVEQVYVKIANVFGILECFKGRPVSIHACLHHPKATVEKWYMDPCEDRKPGAGMLHKAMLYHRIEKDLCTFIGDLDTDKQAAEAASIRYVDAEEFFSA